MKKKFKAKEILSRDQMKKVAGSGYCSGSPFCGGPQGATCQNYLGGCRCMIEGVYYGAPC